MVKIIALCAMCSMSLSGNAQLWNELVVLQSQSPSDSFACGVSMGFGNCLSRIEGRDYTAENRKKISYFNPMLALDIAYDFSSQTSHANHVFVGWNGIFYGDDCLSRIKLGVVRKQTFSYGVLLGKRIVADKEGTFSTRRGKYRHDTVYGLFAEQYKSNMTVSFYGEYSTKQWYHFFEISRRMTEYPKWWVAFASESLRGYGPRMYYKMTQYPLWLHFSMNIAPPLYRDHDNVSNSFQFGFRKMFY